MCLWSSLCLIPTLFSAAEDAPAPFLVVSYGDDAGHRYVDIHEGAAPVLRYCHETTPVPAGIGPEFARGDYVHPLYGLDGEVLTEDYPADHPHHRAVNWSWATIQWRGETRDLFAVRGIYARPVSLRADTTGGKASIDAESVWKWDDKEEVVREKVLIETYLRDDKGRIVDFTIQLTPVVEGIEFCGRLEAGYSGFNVRMAPGEGQRISLYNDPVDALPCRSFGDYSAQFPGGKGRSGLAILQCSANPKYPSEWREYPQLNFFQPAFPGGALIPMPKGETITLKYRLWVHADGVDDVDLAAQWDAYNVKEAKP